MVEDDTSPPQWLHSRVIIGIGLVAAMLIGVFLLLRTPSGSALGSTRATSTTVPIDETAPSGSEGSLDSSRSITDVTTTTVIVGSESAVTNPDPVIIELVDTSRSTVSGGSAIVPARRRVAGQRTRPGGHPESGARCRLRDHLDAGH